MRSEIQKPHKWTISRLISVLQPILKRKKFRYLRTEHIRNKSLVSFRHQRYHFIIGAKLSSKGRKKPIIYIDIHKDIYFKHNSRVETDQFCRIMMEEVSQQIKLYPVMR